MTDRKRSTAGRHGSTYSSLQLAALIGRAALGAQRGAPEPPARSDEACLSQGRCAVSQPASCFPCLSCPGGTAPKADSHAQAVKYVTACFFSTLAGEAAAAYSLTGVEAQEDVAAGAIRVRQS